MLMQIYELINKLTVIAGIHGDLPVNVTSPWGYVELESTMIDITAAGATSTATDGDYKPARLVIDTNKI